MRVRWLSTGVIVALLAVLAFDASAVPADHQAAQPWPISLGVSGGNVYDRSTLYCCSGTLGALVQDGSGAQYILSNNHVLAKSNTAQLGDPINHPGQIDQNCGQDGIVAHLMAFEEILFRKGRGGAGPTNEVDAAIAAVVEGAVRADGHILGVGTLSANTVLPSLGQQVQKSGRTTAHTFGEVAAVNVTVDIAYSSECGGAANQLARFVNQIRVTPGTFSAGGDSGSVIAEAGAADPDDGRPRAVGLLFAGSSTSTLANPINAVLAAFGVTMAGGEPPEPPATGSVSGVVTDAQSGSPIAGAAVSADTGQETATNATGAYVLADVPVGGRTITASASGYAPGSVQAVVEENLTAEANIALEELTVATQSIVQCVTYDVHKNGRHMYVTILVVDDFGVPTPNAQVSISLTLNGSHYTTGTGTTGSNGELRFTANNAPNGTYVTTATNVVASGLSFEGSTPENSFVKGSDSTPASFCRGGGASSASTGGASPGNQAALARAKAVQAAHADALFSLPDVVGHGIGLSSGKPVIEVYLANENARTRAQAPAALEGVPVRIVVTGPFTAY